MNSQMKKGIMEMCILLQLREIEMYGYSLVKQTRVRFPDMPEGTMYVILRRLCTNQYLRVEEKTDIQSGGPPRKYYALTKLGEEYLASLLKQWRGICDSVDFFMQ